MGTKCFWTCVCYTGKRCTMLLFGFPWRLQAHRVSSTVLHRKTIHTKLSCSFVPGFFFNTNKPHNRSHYHQLPLNRYVWWCIPDVSCSCVPEFFIYQCILEQKTMFVELCSRCKTQLSVNFAQLFYLWDSHFVLHQKIGKVGLLHF